MNLSPRVTAQIPGLALSGHRAGGAQGPSEEEQAWVTHLGSGSNGNITNVFLAERTSGLCFQVLPWLVVTFTTTGHSPDLRPGAPATRPTPGEEAHLVWRLYTAPRWGGRGCGGSGVMWGSHEVQGCWGGGQGGRNHLPTPGSREPGPGHVDKGDGRGERNQTATLQTTRQNSSTETHLVLIGHRITARTVFTRHGFGGPSVTTQNMN